MSENLEQHFNDLDQVLKRLTDIGLVLNTKKCHFFKTEVCVSRFQMNKEGSKPDPERIRTVVNFPTPTNVDELGTFLGKAGYFRRSIKDVSTVATPLYALSKSKDYKWTDVEQGAFQTIKDSLVHSKLLAHFNPFAKVYFHTDASSTGLGVVITQVQDDMEKVVAYGSRVLSGPLDFL